MSKQDIRKVKGSMIYVHAPPQASMTFSAAESFEHTVQLEIDTEIGEKSPGPSNRALRVLHGQPVYALCKTGGLMCISSL